MRACEQQQEEMEQPFRNNNLVNPLQSGAPEWAKSWEGRFHDKEGCL